MSRSGLSSPDEFVVIQYQREAQKCNLNEIAYFSVRWKSESLVCRTIFTARRVGVHVKNDRYDNSEI